jgi:hypothetical protein
MYKPKLKALIHLHGGGPIATCLNRLENYAIQNKTKNYRSTQKSHIKTSWHHNDAEKQISELLLYFKYKMF